MVLLTTLANKPRKLISNSNLLEETRLAHLEIDELMPDNHRSYLDYGWVDYPGSLSIMVT